MACMRSAVLPEDGNDQLRVSGSGCWPAPDWPGALTFDLDTVNVILATQTVMTEVLKSNHCFFVQMTSVNLDLPLPGLSNAPVFSFSPSRALTRARLGCLLVQPRTPWPLFLPSGAHLATRRKQALHVPKSASSEFLHPVLANIIKIWTSASRSMGQPTPHGAEKKRRKDKT
jgi:hypothetical protein